MAYVYPIHLMTPRSRRTRYAKGAILLATIVSTIIALAVCSNCLEYYKSEAYIECRNTASSIKCSLRME